MEKKEWSSIKRYALAQMIWRMIAFTNITFEEEDALREAVEIISPEFYETNIAGPEREVSEFFTYATPEEVEELDAMIYSDMTRPEALKQFMDFKKKYDRTHGSQDGILLLCSSWGMDNNDCGHEGRNKAEPNGHSPD